MDLLTISDVIIIAQAPYRGLIVLKVYQMEQHFVKKFVEMGLLLVKNFAMTEWLMIIKQWLIQQNTLKRR